MSESPGWLSVVIDELCPCGDRRCIGSVMRRRMKFDQEMTRRRMARLSKQIEGARRCAG